MSRYAFDRERRTLIVTWATGAGDLAEVVAELPAENDDAQVQQLAKALTDFSATVWRTYTHPASAAGTLEPNTEGWRRHGNREALNTATDALIKPNLPEGGVITVSYVPTEEAAHRVGRVLHAIGDHHLRETITNEIRAELDALERAERGDLTGRARQVVVLSRESASPVQVEAADRLLYQQPLNPSALFTEIDPVAAAVAAPHWLQAAADVVAEQSELDPTDIVVEADNIEALPHRTPTIVLESMAAGVSPYDTVTSLVRGAMAAAEGRIPDWDNLREQVEEASDLASKYGDSGPTYEALLDEIRTTPLDPVRPARDLLEDLLSGIRGCWLLHQEYADIDEADTDEDLDDAMEASTATFIEAVRAEARDNRDRLL